MLLTRIGTFSPARSPALTTASKSKTGDRYRYSSALIPSVAAFVQRTQEKSWLPSWNNSNAHPLALAWSAADAAPFSDAWA